MLARPPRQLRSKRRMTNPMGTRQPRRHNLMSLSQNGHGFTVSQIRFLALGSAIGSGLFVGSAEALHAAGPAILVAYVICIIPIYLIARCLAELALAYSSRGNFIDHVRWQLGRRAGFVCGWSYWSIAILIGMAELTVAGLLVRQWFPHVPQWITVSAMLVLLLCSNLLVPRLFGLSEVLMSSLKLITIVLFIVLALLAATGLLTLRQAHLTNVWQPAGLFPTGFSGFATVLPIALFSFGGFEMISLAAAEAVDPVKALPRAVNGLVLRFLVFYVGATLALLVLMPWREMTVGTSPFVEVLDRLGVSSAASFLNLILISAALSVGNAVIFGASRALLALAAANDAPAFLQRRDGQGSTAIGVLVTVAAMSLAVALNSLLPRQIFGLLMSSIALISIAIWVLVVLAQLRLRQRSRGMPHFAVPGTPWSNVLVLVFLVVILGVIASGPGSLPVFAVSASFLMALTLLALLRSRTEPGIDLSVPLDPAAPSR